MDCCKNQSSLLRVREAGFNSSLCLPRPSKHLSALGQHFFFLIPLLKKPATKQIPDHISRNKPYHG